MNTLTRVVAIAAILAAPAALVGPAPVRGQDAPPKAGGDKAGGEKPAPAPAARKPPKEPSRQVATRIDEALQGIVAGSAASRISSRASLRGAIEEWAADAKDDPLRACRWWHEALLRTLPTSNHKTGVQEISISYGQGREARLWLSVPRSYSTKNLYPLLITVLGHGDDGRRTLAANYGELMKEWIIVAIPSDAKEAGFDVLREPWMAGVGMRYAVENLRVDRDRVVIDGLEEGAKPALFLATEWAVQFAGCVLRSPPSGTPLMGNLALLVPILAPAKDAPAVAAAVMDAAREAASREDGRTAVEVAPGKDAPDRIEKAIQAIPPRVISNPAAGSFTWRAFPQGGEVWAYWVWVFRPAEAKKEKLVSVRFARDPAANAIDLAGENLGELILLLNDDLADLDREMIVRVNGEEVWKGKPERRIDTALYWLGQTGERTLFVPAEVRFTVPESAASPRKAGDAAPAPGEGEKAAPADGGGDKGAKPPPAPPQDDGSAAGNAAPASTPPAEEPPDPGTGE